MKTNSMLVCFCVFFLFCMDAKSEENQKQLRFKNGKNTILRNEEHSRTNFKIGDIDFVVDMTGWPLRFFSNHEFCILPKKNLDEIQDPSQYNYKRNARLVGGMWNAGAKVLRFEQRTGINYDRIHYEQGCVIMAKSGNKYAAIKPINLILKDGIPQCWDKNNKPLSQEECKKWSAMCPSFKAMECEWKYWPNVVKTMPSIDERGYTTPIETSTIKPKEYFQIPGLEDCFVLSWEPARPDSPEPDGGYEKYWRLCCMMYISSVEKIGGMPIHGKTSLEDLKDSRELSFGESSEADIATSSGFLSEFPPAPNNLILILGATDKCASRFAGIELVKATKEQVVYRWKFWRIVSPNQKQIAESEKLKAEREELKKSAGVRNAKIADAKKFYLAGVRFSWDVGDDNSLTLNHEIMFSSASSLEFAVARQNELEDIDVSSLNFREMAGKTIKFPLNRIAVFRSSKGCFAIKPTKVENSGKVVREEETIATKMVTYELRVITEPTRVAQRTTQNE